MKRTNQVLLLDRQAPLFLSAFYALLNLETGSVTFANAGHERPLWWHSNGCIESLDQHDIVLGLFRDISYNEWTVELEAGDCLVLFTDGVTEARNEAGDFFGETRLEQVVAASAATGAAGLRQAIVDAIAAFAGSTPPADDCTVVILRRAA
jgi:sigma-B regulation protein RsbU (phosphoserine phosphatase)